ncbi:MAG: hemolysin family protein [Candidatus Omnitrophota bacterium]
MLLNILIFTVLIGFSAFFSASETAIFSLSNLKLRRLYEKNPRAKIIRRLLKKPTRLLSAIVFGNIMVNIGLASLSTAIFVNTLGRKGLILSIILSGTLILFLGEIFPKTFAIYRAEKVSLSSSFALNIFSKIFAPFISGIEKIVKFFSSFIIGKPKDSSLSGEEFKAALLLGKKDGEISAQEETMISHVLEFKDTNASEILTARIDIKGIDAKLSQEQVIDTLRRVKHSKLPVFEGSLDNIIGILYAKDVFLNQDAAYGQFLREPMFIPESQGIDDVLRLFLEKKERIAIVLDEYGGAEGLITLEDIVEEIFGEIYDEFEKIQAPMEKLETGKWRVYGKTAVKAVNLGLGLDLPEIEDTIAGFLLSEMEKIPKTGEKLAVAVKGQLDKAKIEFTIERATARRIVSVILEKK